MNSSTLSSLLFTLFLILISHAPLPTSGEILYESLCNEAGQDQAGCLQILKEDARFAEAKDYIKLSKLILEMGVKKGTEVQKHLKEIMKTNPSPAITQCATTLYDGVVGSFKSSMGELKVDGLTANYDAKVAGDGPVTCDTALAASNIANPQIAALNKDILLISKLAYLATNKIPTTP
ncbi:hypothetical protein VNO77_33828 [Canavalia gladiata]|uniref:Pectinesterase inhibitor domain-containing protein n=1 Tax=Canavalia gladiata TaxID=3824 RepID=A0AAN9PZ99_CANGL